MNQQRSASLRPYAWLTAAVTLLALLVPFSFASPADADEHLNQAGTTTDGDVVTLDAVPESATNKLGDEHAVEITVTIEDDEDGDTDPDAPGGEFIAQVTDAPDPDDPDPDPPPTDGGLPDGTAEHCAPADPETSDDGTTDTYTCTVTFNQEDDTYEAPVEGDDFIRVWQDENNDGVWQEGEAYDFISKTWVPADDAGDTTRLQGIEPNDNRIGTAVQISMDLYPTDGSAAAVVLARADKFPDALAGTPLATAKDAPLLLTFSDQLHDHTADEIERVLGDDTTKIVYILGGENAISPAVEQAVKDLGYQVERIFGQERVETSIEIAEELGDPSTVLVTSAYRWPDSVVAGAAAAADGDAAVILGGYSDDSQGGDADTRPDKHPLADAYLTETNADATAYAVGGPAVNPYANEPEVEDSVYGAGRYQTSVAAAEFFFVEPTDAGVARAGLSGGDDDPYFADSLTGGVHIGGANGGPMLINQSEKADVTGEGDAETLHPAVRRYACSEADNVDDGWIYGGESALTEDVEEAFGEAIQGDAISNDDDPDTAETEARCWFAEEADWQQ